MKILGNGTGVNLLTNAYTKDQISQLFSYRLSKCVTSSGVKAGAKSSVFLLVDIHHKMMVEKLVKSSRKSV